MDKQTKGSSFGKLCFVPSFCMKDSEASTLFVFPPHSGAGILSSFSGSTTLTFSMLLIQSLQLYN